MRFTLILDRLTSARAALGPAFCTLLLGACAVSEVNPKVYTDYDPGASYAGYRTFAWKSPDPIVVSSPRPIATATRQLMLQDTAALLTAKGMRQVEQSAHADLRVSVVVGSSSGLVVNNYPVWGGNYSDLRDVTTAGLGVELFKPGGEERIWSGWATTGLTEEVYADREHVIKEVLTLVLAEFPPSR